MKETFTGNIIDIPNKNIFKGSVTISNQTIENIENLGAEDKSLPYIFPGFIDAHVHVESSMLVPSEFARLAVVHGTVATINDPHEIANVCGTEGVLYMIENAKTVNFKFHFGAPSCVPATAFETAGAELNSEAVGKLLTMEDIFYLSEMMNFPGVIHGDPEVKRKIELSKENNKPIDGHAPGLMGQDAITYINSGISTDHECFTEEEALHKLKHGMKILIREGSAARNFEALINLLNDHEDEMMFCSDDKHPDSLVHGHIDALCRRAVAKGINVFKVLKAACINPVLHYKMKSGILRQGDPADFIICENLKDFKVLKTYINGIKVAEDGKSLLNPSKAKVINRFSCFKKKPEDFRVPASGKSIRIIHALDGQLITTSSVENAKTENGFIVSNTSKDILKITVINRYQEASPAIAFIQNFGLKSGAIASSVAHDSHNIIAVGVDDESICKVVNMIIEKKGGISVADKDRTEIDRVLSLPVAGLMSNENGYEVAMQYTEMDLAAKELGCGLGAPYMTLSFMALLVIPILKLSDKGLFDGEKFQFTTAVI